MSLCLVPSVPAACLASRECCSSGNPACGGDFVRPLAQVRGGVGYSLQVEFVKRQAARSGHPRPFDLLFPPLGPEQKRSVPSPTQAYRCSVGVGRIYGSRLSAELATSSLLSLPAWTRPFTLSLSPFGHQEARNDHPQWSSVSLAPRRWNAAVTRTQN